MSSEEKRRGGLGASVIIIVFGSLTAWIFSPQSKTLDVWEGEKTMRLFQNAHLEHASADSEEPYHCGKDLPPGGFPTARIGGCRFNGETQTMYVYFTTTSEILSMSSKATTTNGEITWSEIMTEIKG